MVDEACAVVEAGRVHGDQPDGGQEGDGQRKRPVKPADHGLQPLPQRGALEDGVHGARPPFDPPPAADPGKGRSAARRGVPIGAAERPSRVAARSSSLGYWPSSR